jgi:hypothetical protein
MKRFAYIRARFRFAMAEIVTHRGREDAAAALLDLWPKNKAVTKRALARTLSSADFVFERNPEESLRRLTRAVKVVELLDWHQRPKTELMGNLRRKRDEQAAKIAEKDPYIVTAVYRKNAGLDLSPTSEIMVQFALQRTLSKADFCFKENQEESLRRLARAVAIAESLDRNKQANTDLMNNLRQKRDEQAVQLALKDPAIVSVIYRQFASQGDYMQSRFEEATQETNAARAVKIYREIGRHMPGALADVANRRIMNLIDEAATQDRSEAMAALTDVVHFGDQESSGSAQLKLDYFKGRPLTAPWPTHEILRAAHRRAVHKTVQSQGVPLEPEKPIAQSSRKNSDGQTLH